MSGDDSLAVDSASGEDTPVKRVGSRTLGRCSRDVTQVTQVWSRGITDLSRNHDPAHDEDKGGSSRPSWGGGVGATGLELTKPTKPLAVSHSSLIVLGGRRHGPVAPLDPPLDEERDVSPSCHVRCAYICAQSRRAAGGSV